MHIKMFIYYSLLRSMTSYKVCLCFIMLPIIVCIVGYICLFILWGSNFCGFCYFSCSAVFESFGCLYFMYCARVGSSSGKAWEDILHTCCFLHAIQHAMWYVRTSLVIKIAHHECITRTEDQISLPKTWLACNSWILHKTSQAVLLAHA